MTAATRRRATVAVVGVCLLALAVRPAAAGWSREFAPQGIHPSADVQAVSVWNGDLVIGGSFPSAGGYHASGIARWDGERWHAVGDQVSGVTCLTVHDDRLVAGGTVRAEQGRAQALGWWDGQRWQGFAIPLHGDVFAVAVWRGDLVAGGRITIGDHDSTAHLACWDGAAWQPLGAGLAGAGRTRVEALAVWGDDLIVGGVFARAGQVTTSNLARWDGQAWSPCGAAPGADDAVTVLLADDGDLYAAGLFGTIGGVAADRVAAWDGAAWRALATPDHGLGEVEIRALATWRGDLYAAGTLQAAGPDSAYGIARCDGARWRALPRDFVVRHRDRRYLSGAVNALGVYGGRLVAAGRMSEAGATPANGLALWDGAAWDPLVAGQGFAYGDARNVLVLDGRVTVGRGRYPADWIVWRDGAWTPLAVEPQVDTKVLVWPQTAAAAGDTTWILGALHDGDTFTWRLLRWDNGWVSASPALPRFTGGVPASPLARPCAELLVRHRGGVIVTGRFGPDDGAPRDHAVFWDGVSWRGLGMVTDEPVAAIDAACLVAGLPTLAWSHAPPETVPRCGISQWDGERWRTILAADGTGVEAMTAWRGQLVAKLMRGTGWPDLTGSLETWNGSAWETMPGDFATHHAGLGRVLALVPYGDDLVAAGEFLSVDGLACDHLAFLRDGRWWPLGGGTDGWVSRVVVSGNSLWCFGAFLQAGGTPSANVARWDGPLTVDAPRDSLPQREPQPRPDFGARSDRDLPPACDDPAGPFANGDFTRWRDGQPEGWTFGGDWGGRCEGDSIPPVLLAGGGVRLAVPAGVHCAYRLTGRFAMEPGRTYRIRVRSRLVSAEPGRGPEPGVAARLFLSDWPRTPHGRGDGPLHTGFRTDLTDTVPVWREIVLRASPRAAEGLVSLDVRGPGTVFDLFAIRCDTVSLTGRDMMAGLIEELEGHYVPPGDDAVDWDALRARYLVQPVPWTDELPADHPVCRLLAELADPRIVVEAGRSDVGSIRTLTAPTPVPPELALDQDRLAAIKAKLRDVRRIAMSFSGWTADGICYHPLHRSWGGDEPPEDLGPATRGLLLDLRNYDPGGSHDYGLERRALAAAGWFAAGRLAYATAARREAGRLLPPDTLRIEPSSGPSLEFPVVVLIGPGCRGYGAQLAMMLAALPDVVLVGQPTGGTAGLPRRTSLPSGQHVIYRSAVLRTVDGQVVNDDHGLAPDVFVEPSAAGTPVFDRGLEVLREMIAR